MPTKQKSLSLTKKSQVRIAQDLIENSRLDWDFYVMLILSSIVVALGLVINSAPAIIGGMLITPLLTPILTIALGIVISDKLLLIRSLRILMQSITIVVLVSLFIAFLFPTEEATDQIIARTVFGLPYFFIALSAGLAATLSWSKKDMYAMLPGVAISVSIMPPLAVVGISIVNGSFAWLQSSLTSFFLNLLGIILGSIVIFAIFNFQKSKKETEKVVEKEIAKEEKIKEERMEEKIEEEIKEVIKEDKIIKKTKKKLKK